MLLVVIADKVEMLNPDSGNKDETAPILLSELDQAFEGAAVSDGEIPSPEPLEKNMPVKVVLTATMTEDGEFWVIIWDSETGILLLNGTLLGPGACVCDDGAASTVDRPGVKLLESTLGASG
ncbi:hypothetical protein BKA66DRAFT_569699 [Pyrenochaeta sp. MPI-SDFR-AT-0127]|nr:hypothetical protein BKA66DRAFT_569699 [Pyrenochaeta sp. MPI-SDFR-AT-0127]